MEDSVVSGSDFPDQSIDTVGKFEPSTSSSVLALGINVSWCQGMVVNGSNVIHLLLGINPNIVGFQLNSENGLTILLVGNPIYGKIKNVPNHQPDLMYGQCMVHKMGLAILNLINEPTLLPYIQSSQGLGLMSQWQSHHPTIYWGYFISNRYQSPQGTFTNPWWIYAFPKKYQFCKYS